MCGQQSLYVICNNGANTWVISDGWMILDEDPICCTNLVAFDPDKMKKLGCPIVTATTTVTAQNGKKVAIIVCNTVYNKGSPISLCSKYQTCEAGIAIDSVARRHCHVNGNCGTQSIFLNKKQTCFLSVITLCLKWTKKTHTGS